MLSILSIMYKKNYRNTGSESNFRVVETFSILIRNYHLPQYVDDGTTGVLPEENGYGSCPPPSVKDPPLYIQPRMDEPSYDKPIQVHPSIAEFPSHVRKVSPSFFKFRQCCQL